MSSEEDMVSAFLADYFAALVRRDTDWIAARSVSDPPIAFVGIGSLPDETYDLQHLVDHLGAFSPTTLMDSRPIAMVQGGVAWAVDQPLCLLPDGTKIPVRATFLAVKVEAEWKVAHFHVSEGVSHDLAIG